MLSGMPDQFISEDILSREVIIENNISERKDYGIDLSKNNNENDLHHAIGSESINELGILSGCIYTDVNESRQNPYHKSISAIHNLYNDSALDNNGVEDYCVEPPLVITYNLQDNRKSLNDWDNPNFFSIAFLALFPYGDDGHIAPQSTKVSLQVWAK